MEMGYAANMGYRKFARLIQPGLDGAGHRVSNQFGLQSASKFDQSNFLHVQESKSSTIQGRLKRYLQSYSAALCDRAIGDDERTASREAKHVRMPFRRDSVAFLHVICLDPNQFDQFAPIHLVRPALNGEITCA
jgi:hypothetical protein